MIDENKLIKELIPILAESCDLYLAGRIVGCIACRPKVMEWIPVADCLPETPLANIYSEDVLVACSNGRSLSYKVGWYNNEEKEWNKALENYDVVAWMPIPKYKGE